MKVILGLMILAMMQSACFAGLDTDIAETNRVILPSKDWTPTPTESSNALVAIQAYLNHADKLDSYPKTCARSILVHTKEYRVQFVGTVKNGKKVIWCNFFQILRGDREWLPKWKESKVQVCDGGYWFWNINYDPSADKCSDFAPHGVG